MSGHSFTNDLFNTKYDLYSNMIFRLAMTYMKNMDKAEDVVQDVFISLLYKAPEFKSQQHEKYWIVRVTINICKNKCKNHNMKNVELDVLNEMSISQGVNEIYYILQELPEKYRTVIHLYYIEGFSVKEISKMISIGESAIKMRLKRGREILKMEMEET